MKKLITNIKKNRYSKETLYLIELLNNVERESYPFASFDSYIRNGINTMFTFTTDDKVLPFRLNIEMFLNDKYKQRIKYENHIITAIKNSIYSEYEII